MGTITENKFTGILPQGEIPFFSCIIFICANHTVIRATYQHPFNSHFLFLMLYFKLFYLSSIQKYVIKILTKIFSRVQTLIPLIEMHVNPLPALQTQCQKREFILVFHVEHSLRILSWVGLEDVTIQMKGFF